MTEKKYYAVYWIWKNKEILEDLRATKKEAKALIKEQTYFSGDTFIIRELIVGKQVK